MLVGVALGEVIERIEVSDEEILRFPSGIIGFEELGSFALFNLESPFLLLQATADPHAGFVVVDPFLIDPEYEVPTLVGCEVLELGDGDRRSALCIVTLCAEGLPRSVNLRAPIVLNASRRLGVQVILQEDREVRHPIAVLPDGKVSFNSTPAEKIETPAAGTATPFGSR